MTVAQQIREEGRQEGLQKAVLEVLEIRFETVPEGLKEVIEGLQDTDRLRELHRAAIRSETLEVFAATL